MDLGSKKTAMSNPIPKMGEVEGTKDRQLFASAGLYEKDIKTLRSRHLENYPDKLHEMMRDKFVNREQGLFQLLAFRYGLEEGRLLFWRNTGTRIRLSRKRC